MDAGSQSIKSSNLPHGTVTFLFTDIQGSSRLWDQHPDEMREALQIHNQLIRQEIEERGGMVFKLMGDAVCAVFLTAPSAISAACSCQQKLQSQAWPPCCQIRVRMALHTGDAELVGDDYLGPDLNRVARLLSLGFGGQILLSQVTERLCYQRLPAGASLKPLGQFRLKDLTEPEQVFQLSVAGLHTDFPPLVPDDSPSGVPTPPSFRSYEEMESEADTVQKILKIAVEKQTRSSVQEQAERTARELGIPLEAVHAATSQLKGTQLEDQLRQEYINSRKANLRNIGMSVFSVFLIMTVIYALSDFGDYYWPIWVWIWPAIGFVTEFVRYQTDMRDIEPHFQKWKQRKYPNRIPPPPPPILPKY